MVSFGAMSQQHHSYFCQHCHEQRLFVRQGTNHILHLLLTLLLCGTWLIVWLIVAAVNEGKPYLCTHCGLAQHPFTNAGWDRLLAWFSREENSWKAATILLGTAMAIAALIYFTK